MIGRFRAVSAEEMATILRLHHAEQWPVGTIATQIDRHHDTVERVLTQSGLPVTKQSPRTRLVDPYLPFIHETLAKYPRLRASRLWSMVKQRGYTLIPLQLYLKRGKAKVELGLARGKRQYDKRAAIAERDAQREIQRHLGTRRH